MDLLMGSFADAYVAHFTAAELDEYEALLELSDPELYSWLTGLEPVPDGLNSGVMEKFCAHRFRA